MLKEGNSGNQQMRQTWIAFDIREQFNQTQIIPEEPKKYRLRTDSIQMTKPEGLMIGTTSTTSQNAPRQSLRGHKNSFNP
jgi:hypothetical protein